MNCRLTKQEIDWLIQGLKTLETCEYRGGGKWRDDKGKIKPLDAPLDATPYLQQISNLRVVKKCQCDDPDCHTIKFQHFEAGKCPAMITSSIEDGRMLIIDVHKEKNLLAGLEII